MMFSKQNFVELHASAFARMGLSIACLCAMVCGAQAQDLYADLVRQVVSYPGNAAGSASSYTATSSPFTVGFVEDLTQPIFSVLPSPFLHYSNNTLLSTDYDLITALKDGFSSGIFWNLHTYDYTLGSGLTLASESVTLSSVDVIPTIQIDLPRDSTTSHSVVTNIQPVTGSSPYGYLKLYSLVNGTWTPLASYPVSSAAVDTESITANQKTRLRWVLVRSSTAPIQVVISVRVSQ